MFRKRCDAIPETSLYKSILSSDLFIYLFIYLFILSGPFLGYDVCLTLHRQANFGSL